MVRDPKHPAVVAPTAASNSGGGNPHPELPTPISGRRLLRTLPPELYSKPAVFTQPEPWQEIAAEFTEGSPTVHFVTGLEHEHVRAVVEGLDGPSAIFGIGGGSAVDFAKYAAWQLQLPLVLMPSVLSVDAAFTRAAAVREGSLVRYEGEVIPDYLLIDYDLLEAAPPILNRAGAADVLSIFTALWDWAEAAHRTDESFAPEVAAQARDLLLRLFAGADDLRQCNPAGLKLLAELFLAEVELCELVGNARPEEGSEHYLAYCVERLTGRSFIHGQLVGLCISIVARYQGQDGAPVAAFLERAGLDCSLDSVRLTREELRQALLAMPEFVKAEKHLLPGVFHFREAITPETVDALLAHVE